MKVSLTHFFVQSVMQNLVVEFLKNVFFVLNFKLKVKVKFAPLNVLICKYLKRYQICLVS